ncbi:hypothetical protein ABW19_dt0203362 [Dactylella cylindrospora]|nr:hypothetical protein ABW19_dt0203362 [Dactylella cylindrospora]
MEARLLRNGSNHPNKDGYGPQGGVINTRVRLYTLLTIGTILCYMYYTLMSSSFRGYQFSIYGTAGPQGLNEAPVEGILPGGVGEITGVAEEVTSVVEVDVTKVISTVFEAAPTGGGGGNSGESKFWLANMVHRGVAPYHSDKDYKVFRNVRDYGAKGDGVTDDTKAINDAINAGSRCIHGCESSTISPALIFFPGGRYLVSQPIIALYYSQLVGDPLDMPVLLAAKEFDGIAVIDTDPYGPLGENWYINQNNFFRAIRNFVIDLTGMDPTKGVG